MPLTQNEKMKILEAFLAATGYPELAWLLYEGPEDQLEVDTVRAAYTSKNDMLNKINDYANTHEGHDKVTELFGEGDHTTEVNNKLTENVNTFWANTTVAAEGTRKTYKKKAKHRKGKKSRGKSKSRKTGRNPSRNHQQYLELATSIELAHHALSNKNNKSRKGRKTKRRR